jgi:hypothetical protein
MWALCSLTGRKVTNEENTGFIMCSEHERKNFILFLDNSR